MRKIVAIGCIILFSCVATKSKEVELNYDKSKKLDFLYNYQTRIDSSRNKKVIYYDKLYLKEERFGTSFKVFLKDSLVFEGDKSKYQYLFEVFDNSSLFISYVFGKSGAAGPDLFERDSVMILDIGTATMAKVNLRKIYLTRSSDFLFKAYRCPADTLKFENEYKKYCAIDSVDIINYKLLLINQCHKAEKFAMVPSSIN